MILLIFALIQSALAIPPQCEVYLSRVKDAEAELSIKSQGFKFGHLRYRTFDTDAIITSVYINETFRGQGASTALMYGMLQRSPEIKKIEALLVMTNLEASGLKYVRKKITDAECRDAASRAPLVRSLSHLGFKLSKCYFNPEVVFLEVEMSRE